jgi:DHA1 family bicyclomycin/chloramphenicol resistance-like MFS transporter
MTTPRYFFLILLLGALTALGPFSIDLYLPAFPAIAHSLHTNGEQVALSLSSFFVGIAVGQLLYGPLLDRFGRKKPLVGGLVIYVVASVGCLAVQRIETLIALRFVQALGSCAAAVTSMALVRDWFSGKETAKIFALLMLVFSVSPLLAPTLGGYVTATYGWPAVFLVLGAWGSLLLLATVWWLPDRYTPDPTRSLRPRPILASFWAVLREPPFTAYALSGATSLSGLFAYVAGSPLLFLDLYHVEGRVYGWLFAFLSLAPFTRLGGSAAALMGALEMGMGALTSMGVSLFHTRSAVPMAALMATAALLALALLLVSRQRIAAPPGGAEPGS